MRIFKNYYACIINFSGFFVALLFLMIAGCAVKKETISQDDRELKLPSVLADSKQEYSSMCWYGDKLLLIPQFPDSAGHAIYAFKREAIENAVANGKALEIYDSITLPNLWKIKNAIGKTYEGIEATVIIEDKIFFTIETKQTNENCYLIEGLIKDNIITINPAKLIPIPKLKRLSNAGFESMTYLPKLNKLLLLFEYNKADIGPNALLIDTSLMQKPTLIPMDPLMYRLTDVTLSGNNKLLGLNYHYNKSKTEFPEYIGADSLMVEPILKGKKLSEASFSRIIEFSVDKRITYKTKRVIGVTADNWEGIVPFKNGALIVTDEYSRTILKYIKF